MVYRLDTLYHFMPGNTLVPYVAGGLGGITLDPDSGGTDTDFLVNYGFGLKYFFTEDLALRGDVRHIYAFGDPENNFVYTAGLTYLMGGKVDQPPAPLPVADSDGDGVSDLQDRCPGTPAGEVVEQACPLDTDGDGIYDQADRCWRAPAGWRSTNKAAPSTATGGVYDYLDKLTRRLRASSSMTRVVPSTTTATAMASPTTSMNARIRAGLTVDQGEGLPHLHHPVRRIRRRQIRHQAPLYGELAKGAAFIQKYSDQKILIAGHTDSTASEAYNEILSQRRAESVRNTWWRISASMPINSSPGRLPAETRPHCQQRHRRGRQRNRRVELSCCAVIPQ
ncbi:MAG: OmpA family protein [Syntrophotaleaceae bacterium]